MQASLSKGGVSMGALEKLIMATKGWIGLGYYTGKITPQGPPTDQLEEWAEAGFPPPEKTCPWERRLGWPGFDDVRSWEHQWLVCDEGGETCVCIMEVDDSGRISAWSVGMGEPMPNSTVKPPTWCMPYNGRPCSWADVTKAVEAAT